MPEQCQLRYTKKAFSTRELEIGKFTEPEQLRNVWSSGSRRSLIALSGVGETIPSQSERSLKPFLERKIEISLKRRYQGLIKRW